jgi:hypothetical protein
MTPKEKAIYLYIMYKQRTSYREVFHTQELLDKFHDNAKSCALIAVEEILNDPFYTNTINISGVYYWQEVKKEIEAL